MTDTNHMSQELNDKQAMAAGTATLKKFWVGVGILAGKDCLDGPIESIKDNPEN